MQRKMILGMLTISLILTAISLGRAEDIYLPSKAAMEIRRATEEAKAAAEAADEKLSKWELLEQLSFWDWASSTYFIPVGFGIALLIIALIFVIVEWQNERLRGMEVSISRDRTITERNQSLREAYRRIEQLQDEIRSLQFTPQVTHLTQEIAQLKNQLTSWQKAVEERDQIIQQLKSKYAQREQALQALRKREENFLTTERSLNEVKEKLSQWQRWHERVIRDAAKIIEQFLKEHNREALEIGKRVLKEIFGEETTEGIIAEVENSYARSLPKGDTRDIKYRLREKERI
jgi:phage host-nuclease inhibitor protein Gam